MFPLLLPPARRLPFQAEPFEQQPQSPHLQHHNQQSAMLALFRLFNCYVGNLEPIPGVFPDYPAPVVRNGGTERELVLMPWGMPPPPRTGGPPVNNIRNTSSPHWRVWLKPESDAWSQPTASL